MEAQTFTTGNTFIPFVGLLVVCCSTVAGVVIWGSAFVPRKGCEETRSRCNKEMTRKLADIWNKIDQIHSWMISGVISVNRHAPFDDTDTNQ